MPKTPPPAEFKIHVDGSCLTNSTDLQMPATERSVSDQTVVHHDSWSEEAPLKMEDTVVDKVAVEDANEERSQDEKDAEQIEEGYDANDSEARDARERQIDRIEAKIQAAARAVVASIEKDQYGDHNDSVLSTQLDESYEDGDSQATHDEGTELTYGDGTELTYDGAETRYEPHSDHEEDGAGDSSSHHDGDIDDDDVFSQPSGHSQRSSLNSIHDLSDEVKGKELTSPRVGEEAYKSSPAPEEQETISRIPSAASYVPRDTTPATPSKVLSRPPFRTPSSVRAMQMSSPTPSVFSSPRSSKRHITTVSRVGTPTSFHSPSRRTPRFRAKKLDPLVLLHVTVLPLRWNYSHIISSPELPSSLYRIKETWKLLQEKLGDMVLERGILLSHPQDSYEVLEERLLEALELPGRSHARILKCGHYMGPGDLSSDEEGVAYFEGGTKVKDDRRWCDICRRDVRLEGSDFAGREGEMGFRIKIYASNGLMSAGAWGACYREMESVDIEIEPFVESQFVGELEAFAAIAVVPRIIFDDGFVDEDVHEPEPRGAEIKEAEEAHLRAEQEEEMARVLMEEEDLRQRAQNEEDLHRKAQDEERMREIYGQSEPAHEEQGSRSPRRPSRSLEDDSLRDLLAKAFKVAMRDKKNIIICVLSVIVLLLVLRPAPSAPEQSGVIMAEAIRAHDAKLDAEMERIRLPDAVIQEAPFVAYSVVAISSAKKPEKEVWVANAESHDPCEVVDVASRAAIQSPPVIESGVIEEVANSASVEADIPPAHLPLEEAILELGGAEEGDL